MIDTRDVIAIALEAGTIAMEIYNSEFDIDFKQDKSIITQADLAVNTLICQRLSKLYPEIPILSEENKEVAYEQRKDWQSYWCIDPIDGTKEFVKKNGEFTINIALIQHHQPIFGLVYAPALHLLYHAYKGHGAYKQNPASGERLRLPLQKKNEILSLFISRSRHTQETQNFIDTLKTCHKNIETQALGSSLKFCIIAEGIQKRIYPKFAATMEWDTAAAHIILKESGGEIYIYDPSLKPCDYLTQQVRTLLPLHYNKKELTNPDFIALL